MPRTRRWLLLPLLMCAAFPAAAHAQSRAISLWLGAGRTVYKDSISFSPRNLDAHGAVQLDLPLFPVALRGDVTFAGGDFREGRRNVIASAVVPLRLPVIQPYAMAGYGIYDWGKGGEERGLSYGAGVRLQLGGLGLFGQLRRHEPLDRSVATLGVVF
ncbi:MAG: hypothetical protein IPF87_05240 [Gemmatimonadetes bacterium]|jgi:hypothetical protein|nr:hypothetical protein [Gemmatimonadota bacterium]MBK6455468.1 hypothetical protein [Gemmatimonadota bacterium]MBK6841638.1 hypothetical protein [Gemmatimonadota bacterium]MBK7835342.1 hypothetical protein [Gemmatimonadota bacterium]MBK8645392.1 hypothetical protein [Gemmatimonadota bacterium]